MAQAHEMAEVNGSMAACRAAAAAVRGGMGFRAVARVVEDAAEVPEGGVVVSFIRHGEGIHNVAQREWRAAAGWDGASEPYTLDNDPGGAYQDALLTPKGEAEARALRARAEAMPAPQLMVVSPLRRSTQTGLLAFERRVAEGLPVLAHDLAHETGGRHTCDRRLPRAQLQAQFPAVDYGLLEQEEDPLWGDGVTRETWPEVCARAGRFLAWLRGRAAPRSVVAAHSGFLLSMFNGVLELPTPQESTWFGTGEMRTVCIRFE